MRRIARFGFFLVPVTTFALLAGCGSGVKTSGAQATPTPSQGTPTPGPTGTASPAPTGAPTPVPSSATCSFVWLTDYSAIDGRPSYDFYEVDVLQTAWNNATNAFGDNAVGYWISGYDPTTNEIVFGAGMTTAGAIALNVSNMNMGTAAGFTDTASHTYYDAKAYFQGTAAALGAQIATGGTGSWTGNLSDPDPNAPVDPGTGTIDVTDGTVTETFADPAQSSVSYAYCSAP